MRNSTVALILIILLALPVLAYAQIDTVKIVSVQVDADPVNPVKFGVPVNLVVTGDPGNVNHQISAATLGHYFDPGDYVTIDSVRLTGGLADNPIYFGCFHDNSINLGVIGFILYFNAYIIPGESGLLGTMWFTLDAGAPDHIIEIDSGFFPDAGEYVLTNGNGFNIVPEFVGGTITVGTGVAAELVVSPTALTFDATEGGADPASQSFNISNAQSGDMDWTASEDAGWIDLSETSGTVPPAVDVDVSISISGLAAGTHVDTILVEAAGANNSPQEVIITLNLEAQPVLSVDPLSLLFEGVEGGTNPAIQNISIDNTGGGVLDWTASYDAIWLSVDPVSGTGPDILDVEVDLTSLTAGTYVDTIVIIATGAANSPQEVEVTFNVEAPPSLSVTPLSLLFEGVEGGINPVLQNISIDNTGGGVLDWTATYDAAWLSVSPVSGTGPDVLDVEVDMVSMTAGTYVDTIVIDAGDADNSPQEVEVTLTVDLPPMIVMGPASFFFSMTNADAPQTDECSITNGGGGDLVWSASHLRPWLSLSPENGTAPSAVTLTVDASGMNVGVYRDTITITGTGASNSPQVAEVLLEVRSICMCGDANSDSSLNVSDAVYIINSVFVNGPDPDPLCCADANDDNSINVSDAVYIINNIFVGGPLPLQTCCDSEELTTVTDYDGNVYQAIKIGDQWWMMENLKVTHYRNGDPIPNVTDNGAWGDLTTGAYCDYNNDPANVATYGRLYNWYAVDDGRNIAPEGWHVPSDTEIKQLEMYLGMSQAEADAEDYRGTDEGGKLKETGTTHWNAPNYGATNESGFSALPGGGRYPGGMFHDVGGDALYWSSTESFSDRAWRRRLNYEYSQIHRNYIIKQNAFSVRCVRD